MKNVRLEVENPESEDDAELVIRIKLSKRLGRSKGGLGKSMVVATTNGNMEIPGTDPPVRIGINAYIPDYRD